MKKYNIFFFLLSCVLLFVGCGTAAPSSVTVDTTKYDRVTKGGPSYNLLIDSKAELLKKPKLEVSVLDRVDIYLEGPAELNSLRITVRSQRSETDRGIVPEDPQMPEGITQDDLGRFTVTVKEDSAGIFAEIPRFLDTRYIYLEVEGPGSSYAAARKEILDGEALPSFTITATQKENIWSLSIK